MNNQSEQYHFIIGMPRSGTTLLSSELNKFENVLVLLESLHVKKMLKNRSDFSAALTNYYDAVLPKLKDKPYTVTNEIYKIIETANSRNIIENSIAIGKCFTFFDLKKNPNIIIDKNPVYTFLWRDILKEFPNSKFVITIRNPKAFVLSKVEKKHPKEKMTSPYYFANLWNEYMRDIFNLRQQFPNKVMLVRYEDLVSETDIIDNIAKFLGVNKKIEQKINLEEKYRKFISSEMSDRHKTKYLDLSKPINKKRVNAFEDALDGKLQTRIDSICRENMKLAGYEIAVSKTRTPLWNFAYLRLARLYRKRAMRS